MSCFLKFLWASQCKTYELFLWQNAYNSGDAYFQKSKHVWEERKKTSSSNHFKWPDTSPCASLIDVGVIRHQLTQNNDKNWIFSKILFDFCFSIFLAKNNYFKNIYIYYLNVEEPIRRKKKDKTSNQTQYLFLYLYEISNFWL